MMDLGDYCHLKGAMCHSKHLQFIDKDFDIYSYVITSVIEISVPVMTTH
jgi:hypothetical protein